MYFNIILVFSGALLLSSFSHANQDCHDSLGSIKKDLDEINYEESVDINNDGIKENVIFWGCGASGCNSSLVIKSGSCFSVVLESENLTFHKGIPESLPKIYEQINSEYLIAESNYTDCLGFNSTKQMFIFSKSKNKYELFYEENIRLCNHQDHSVNN